MLVARAFNVRYDQLAALDWMTQQRFDIAARVPADASKAKVEEMWQALLIDWFKLAAHRASRVVAKFDLQVAKGGPKFKDAREDPGFEQARPGRLPRTDQTGNDRSGRPNTALRS